MQAFEERRRAAVGKFWRRLIVGIALSAGLLLLLLNAGWETTGWILFFLGLLAAFIAASIPLMEVKEGLKHPVLEELARSAGMEFLPADFVPPVFESARTLLFGGGGFSSRTFSDLFNGTDGEGRGCAVYEASLQRRAGRNSYIVFQGQMYAVLRRPGPNGWTVIRPDRKFLNFWKPASDLERVPLEEDKAFERRFEVYGTDPGEARALARPSLRALLLDLRETGRVFVYAAPEEALVALWGKDRFEPGSMLRARPAADRVRAMFDEVRASLATLERIRTELA
jgi:hypothetical protein